MSEKPCIFIVDDEQFNLDTIEALLFSEDYTLEFAEDGNECLEKIDEVCPDVILLDVMMPGIDGFEVCKRIKNNKKWNHIPILMVTALDTKEDLAKGLDAGADDFLHKPVNGIELRARVRSLLRVKFQFDELQSNLKMREDLSHMIAHDIRTPLSVILGMATLIKMKLKDDDLLMFIKKIVSNTNRVNSFLNDLLLLAKMKGDNIILNKTIIDIPSLVNEVFDNHKDIAESKAITLRLKKEGIKKGEISVDKNLITRVLDNLISNALKFSPKDSVVTIRLDNPDNQQSEHENNTSILIKVEDNGCGIPKEDQDKVFNMYESSGKRDKQNMSFGLGLTFCKMVVEAHGGKICAGDNHPSGTVITIEL